MRYYRLLLSNVGSRLVVEAQEGVLHDLTSIDEDLDDLKDLVQAASLHEIVQGYLKSQPNTTLSNLVGTPAKTIFEGSRLAKSKGVEASASD